MSGQPTVIMYSTAWCGYCHRLKSQMDREGIEFEVVDIERHPEAASIVAHHNRGNHTVPTLLYPDGIAHTNPGIKDVKSKIASLN